MIAMRHAGIYVRDIKRLEAFYTMIFRLVPICSMEPDEGELLDELLGIPHVRIVTTKLVTEYGKQNGQGDMLELVKICCDCPALPKLPPNHPISIVGMGHIAFGIDDITWTVDRIIKESGSQGTKIYKMKNQNLCCFCRDPEGNWLELIERADGQEDIKMDKLKGETAFITGGSFGIGGGKKVVLITGGTSGIGLALAKMVALEDSNVVIAARDKEKGLAQQEQLRKQDRTVSFIPCDVTQKQDVERLYDRIHEQYGRLDILVNSAGVFRTERLEDITDENWDANYNTNVKAVMYMCQSGMPLLQAAPNGGVILNIASDVGLQSRVKGRSNLAYASAKAAQIQFTQLLAKNFGPQVRVNCLCPGSTATPIWENRDFERFKNGNLLNKIFTAEDVARVALFMISDAASIMTGSVVTADGGEHLVG